MTITCPCGQRKKEVKCLTSSGNPTPSHPRMECDDECLRLERNRRLADALNIDPSSELTDHVPYSDTTIRLFRELGAWAEDKEREFRVFAQSKDELRMRFAPMPSAKRQFLHVLAADFRLESYSEDREPHRHVVVSKQMLFVSTPSKTVGQCVKIRERQAAEKAAEAAASKVPEELDSLPPFNAMLLTSAAFGLTIDDIKSTLNPIFATRHFSIYAVEFLHGDEVLIRIIATYSASVAPSGLEAMLDKFREQMIDVVKSKGIAGGILLAHADPRDRILRRERPNKPDPTGWNAVAGRAAKKEGSFTSEPPVTGSSGRRMLGLRKKPAEKKWGVLDGDVEC